MTPAKASEDSSTLAFFNLVRIAHDLAMNENILYKKGDNLDRRRSDLVTLCRGLAKLEGGTISEKEMTASSLKIAADVIELLAFWPKNPPLNSADLRDALLEVSASLEK